MRSPQPRMIGALAALMYIGLAVSVLSQSGWNPTIFIGFGVEATATTDYAQARLGDVALRGQHGHDGKDFFVLANDPLLIQPESNALLIDEPLYRAQRIFYPALAGGFGLFEPRLIVWMMLILNVIGMGLGSWAVANLAVQTGSSGWWGMAFALNLGLIGDLLVSGSGIIATALLFVAIGLLLGNKVILAVLLLTFMVLTREAMFISVIGISAWLWSRDERRHSLLALGIPVFAFAAWATYARIRLGSSGSITNEGRVFGPPFVGLIQAMRGWSHDNPLHAVAGVSVLLIAIVVLARFRRWSHVVSWSAVGFAAVTLLFAREVWQAYWDIARVEAPLLTAFVLGAFVFSKSADDGDPRTFEVPRDSVSPRTIRRH